MEPFIQTCAACQSRIRVRNQNMIGQVVDCPKCHAPLAITSPQKIHVAGARGSVADSQAMTKESLPSPDEFESLDFSRPEDLPVSSPPPLSLFDGELLDSELMLQPEEQFSIPAPTSSNPAWTQPEKPLLPSEQWTSPSATRRQQVLMIAMIGAFSLLVAVGSFYAFVRWVAVPKSADQPVAINPDDPAPQLESPAAQTPATEAETSEPNAEPSASTTGEETQAPILPSTETSEDTGTKHVGSELDPDNPPASNSVVVGPPGVDTTPVDSNQAPSVSEQSASVTLGSEKSQANPVLSLPPGLQELAGILDATKIAVVDSSIPLVPQPNEKEGDDAAEPFAESKDGAPSPDATEIAKSLQVQLDGISIAKRPLTEGINVLAQLANLPLSVDFDSLAIAEIDRHQKMEFKEMNRTVADVLTSFASSIGAQFENRQHAGMMLVGSSDRLAAKLSNSIDISNLDSEKQVAWAQSLDAIFPDKKDTWRLVNGHIQTEESSVLSPQWLQLTNTIQSWQRCESRAAKAPTFPFAAIERAMDLKLTLKIMDSKQLWVILTQAFREAKIHCWIDWPSLIRSGVTPQSSTVVLTHQRSLKEVLAEVQRRYDLVFVIDDPQTVLVTTRAGRVAHLKAYVFDAENRTAEQWKEHLELAEPGELAGLPPFRIAISPSGNFAIVRCARFEIGL